MSSNATAPSSSSSSLFFIGNNTGGTLIALLEDGLGASVGLDDGLGTVEDGGLDDDLVDGFGFVINYPGLSACGRSWLAV